VLDMRAKDWIDEGFESGERQKIQSWVMINKHERQIVTPVLENVQGQTFKKKVLAEQCLLVPNKLRVL